MCCLLPCSKHPEPNLVVDGGCSISGCRVDDSWRPAWLREHPEAGPELMCRQTCGPAWAGHTTSQSRLSRGLKTTCVGSQHSTDTTARWWGFLWPTTPLPVPLSLPPSGVSGKEGWPGGVSTISLPSNMPGCISRAGRREPLSPPPLASRLWIGFWLCNKIPQDQGLEQRAARPQ